MRALVIVHDPGSEAVLVGDRLEHHGFTLDRYEITTVVNHPVGSVDEIGDPNDYDLIVPMGSIWSVYDTDRIGSWVGDELEYLRRADEADVPVFGVCFGAQALAAALGGRVVRSETPQVGWHPLEVDPGVGLPSGPWMQWHYDRFEPPTDATVLAEDGIGVQAFAIRRHLGVQFHPEVTRAHLDYWMDLSGTEELDDLGISLQDLLDETSQREGEVVHRTNQLVDWFLNDIAKL